MRVADVLVRVSPVGEDEDLERAGRELRRHGLPALPVVSRSGAVVGLVLERDLPRAGPRRSPAELAQLRVEDVMTRDVTTIEPEASVGDAAGLLLEQGIRHLPVVDAFGRLVGLIAERDIRAVIGTDLHDFPRATGGLDELVSNAMAADPIAVRVGTPLTDALDTFADERIGAVPVLDDDDRVVGILSYVDVLAWIRRSIERFEAVASPP